MLTNSINGFFERNDDLTFYQVKRKNTQDISFEKVEK